jgi:carbon starvation protein
MAPFLANTFYEVHPKTGDYLLRAMPAMLVVLCILAIAYRYYSAFLARRVAGLDDSRPTPAHRFNDGQNFHPTSRWVLFGHHFAAISGAGPLIGPVLAMQYGYAPGLLWLVIGVCLAGAVQDMLVLFASVRRNGKSLAEIARTELGPTASVIASIAILFIVIIALAGLAFVVVKALGGEQAKLPVGMQITVPWGVGVHTDNGPDSTVTTFPGGCSLRYAPHEAAAIRSEGFAVKLPSGVDFDRRLHNPEGLEASALGAAVGGPARDVYDHVLFTFTVPPKAVQVIPGSSWGTFTIACTIPIALFVGLWMYRIRPGRVVEASAIGASAVLFAVMAGAWIKGTGLEPVFTLSRESTIIALCVYGFIAAILPVWLLLTPRDYLSSYMKIGTLVLLVVGVILANPTLQHPPINETFRSGGPTFRGGIFPFVFICVMCGAISGFHSLVSSGTTPKMIDKESDIRPIGYGAMLTEGLVGVVALIAAASLPQDLYYAMNVDVERAPEFQSQLDQMYKKYGIGPESADALHKAGVRDIHQLNLAQVEEMVGGESLRGRTGGAVTLAVSMSMILTNAFNWADAQLHSLMKYWYHFAIMFEALFILTTIDAGTRIARYLFQETLGKIHPKFGQTNWLPGALVTTAVVTAGWGILVHTGQINTIWPMFGIANQLLAVLALALVTTFLIHAGRHKYAPLLTLLPMLFVTTTTLSAGTIMIQNQGEDIVAGKNATVNALNMGLTVFVILCVMSLVVIAASRWVSAWMGVRPARAG